MNNPMKSVPAPKFKIPDVELYTQDEIERILKASAYAREADAFIRRKYSMRLPTANRDQAIILTLLDSGIRASEFSSLRVGDFEAKRGKLDIRHGEEGGAKGGKGRIVYLGNTARHAVWRYLAGREDGEDPSAPVFTVRRGRAFNADTVRHLIKSIAEKVGVKKAYPHKFRHTFAITYLRSGGDVFTLQSLLGHGSLDMVRHYARIAQVDVEQAHRRASPVDNWRLFRVLEGPFADPFNNGLYSDVITLTNAALVDMDKMAPEEIYYWRGMAKANLEDWDGAAQDLRRAHLLNPNFLPAGEELRRIHSLG
jgi:integrase/recombinase XerD